MTTEIKTNVVKVKPNFDGSSSKGKSVLPPNKKKIESSSTKHVVDSKNTKSVTTVTKSVVKDKGSASSSKTIASTTTVKVKAQKKVYTLTGQKYDPPEEREPLRIFYESLSKQIPSSEMAEFWMMEHGMLSPEQAKRAYERKQKRQQQLRMGTPIKSESKPYRPGSFQSQKQQVSKSSDIKARPQSSQSQKQQLSKSVDIKPKKRIMSESDDDEDFIVKRKK